MRPQFFLPLCSLCAVLLHASCKSNEVTATNTTTTIGQQCITGASSDGGGGSSACAGGSICSVNFCRTPCTTDANCPGSICLSDPGGNGCRLLDGSETTCSPSKPCKTPGLVCGTDMTCRNFCNANTLCTVAGDTCVEGACVGPGGGPGDAGGGGGQDATTGSQDAGGGSSDGGDGGASGSLDSGMTLNPCPAAQEQFGFTAQGDSNSNFTSGVGVRTATQLLVFNGYTGASISGVDASAGDGGNVNLVFAQSFDPATAARLGPPTVLFQAPDGDGFTLVDVSSAPSGQIALAFSYGAFNGVGMLVGRSHSLYAALLAPSADGGSVQASQFQQLETGLVRGQPHVIWSVASQSFVFSWEYIMPGYAVATKVAQLLPDGRPGNGASGAVPTDVANGLVSQLGYDSQFSGAAGTSGKLLGVAYLSNASFTPFLTILDPAGNQVGNSVQVAGVNSTWVAVAGTSQGFVTFYDNGTGVSETFVGVSADGGVPASSTDGGDAGALPGFVLPGAADALDVRAVGDDTGGPGGVGAALLYPTQVGFAYLNPDGRGPLAHFNPILPHTYAAGDFVAISNYKGLFAVSVYDSMKHSTQVIASGCP